MKIHIYVFWHSEFHAFFPLFFISGQSTNGNGKDKQLNGNSNGDNGLDTAGTTSEAQYID